MININYAALNNIPDLQCIFDSSQLDAVECFLILSKNQAQMKESYIRWFYLWVSSECVNDSVLYHFLKPANDPMQFHKYQG